MSHPKDYLPELLHLLQQLIVRRAAGGWDGAAFAALYFLYWQIALHGDGFASRKRKSEVRPDAAAWLGALETLDAAVLHVRLLDYLERYQFRGVIRNVPVALSEWLRGNWRLELRADIPRPIDVLRAQARGTRPVTVITAYPRLLDPVLNKPNAYAFFLHDIEHAYKFFHSPALYAGQCAFFAALASALDRGMYAPYLGDPVFVGKFHYLMSDMNTHPQHSRQYLRAILIETHLRREGKALSAPLGPAGERAIDDAMRAVEGSGLPPAAGGEQVLAGPAIVRLPASAALR